MTNHLSADGASSMELPMQPSFPTWCLSWEAYDVPRIWDMVRQENDKLGREQVLGFGNLSEVLIDACKRLMLQHEKLSASWQSPTATQVLLRIRDFAYELRSEAHCAATTAPTLHIIMEALDTARSKIEPLRQRWDKVTTDLMPDWWDHAAQELNTEARTIMATADDTVRDHRNKIIVPALFHRQRMPIEPIEPSDGGAGPVQTGTPLAGRVPAPLAGYVPAPVPGRAPAVPPDGGPGLAGMPLPIPAMPGQPVSMLPIPPGSVYAPFGGAYVLPGPGVGRGGYVVPMPHPAYGPGGGQIYYPGSGAAGAAGGMGMMPMPMPMGTPGMTGGGQASMLAPRSATTKWEVHQGVPEVIEGFTDDTFIPDQPSPKQQEQFRDWFGDLAYPWRNEAAGNTAKVVFREVSE